MNKKTNPLSVYAVASQFAFTILAPLLVFIVGGHYASKYFGWPDWAMGLCVILGVVFMIGGMVSFLAKLINRFAKDDPKKKNQRSFYSDPRDNDYYDEYKNLRK